MFSIKKKEAVRKRRKENETPMTPMTPMTHTLFLSYGAHFGFFSGIIEGKGDEIKKNIEMKRPLLSLTEVASFLKVSRSTLYEIMKRGELPYIRVSGSRRVCQDDLKAFLSAAKETAL